MAIVMALLTLTLMSALGGALVLTTTSETLIVSNFRASVEGQYAAEAAVERAVDDLAEIGDWSSVLGGLIRSSFVDGPPAGVRRLPDGSLLDLDRVRNILNCRKAAACSGSDLAAVTSDRPWGANNPVWQLFAYGPLAALHAGSDVDSTQYVIVFAADDPSENDDDPLLDGVGESNPGSGVVTLRGEAFGPRGSHQVLEVTVSRPANAETGVRVLAWHVPR